MFDLLDQDKKDEIEKTAREFVGEASQKASKNFKELDSKHGKTYVKKAIESVEYVMDNKDRYRLMAIILREFDAFTAVPEGFTDEYAAAVITPRIQLAHSKLFYGECKKKLHIAKTRQEFRCDQNCEHCSSKYSIDSCETLRKKLFEYYQIFQEIDREVSLCLEGAKQPLGV